MTVAIIDYGMGNLRSVAKAFESVGAANLQVTDDPGVLAAADRLVFPGQGAIGSCFRHLAFIRCVEVDNEGFFHFALGS